MKVAAKSSIRLLFPYLVIVIVPILALFVSWNYVSSGRIRTIIDEQNSAIDIAAERVDERIQSVVELSMLVSENNNVRRYMTNAKLGKENDVFACQEISSLLSSVSQNEAIAQIYLFDSATGRIISSDTVLNDAQLFFEYNYVTVHSDSQTVLQTLMDSTWGYSYRNVGTILIHKKPVDVIEYQRSVPVYRYGKRQLQLIICLDTDRLFQDFLDMAGHGAQFAVYSSDGLLYSSEGAQPEMTGTELSSTLQRIENKEGVFYAAQLQLDSAMWSVQFFYSDGFLTDESQNLVWHLLWTVILPTIICICICIYFTYRNYREIVGLLSLLRGEGAAKGDEAYSPYIDYRLVHSYAVQTVQKNIAYRAQLWTVQKNTVLDRLLRNSYHSEEEKTEAQSKLELSLTGDRYVVLCLQADELIGRAQAANDTRIRDEITDLLLTHIGTQIECVDQHPLELVYILGIETSIGTLADNIISLLTVQISYRYDLNLKIGIGNPVDSLSQINLSYDQAREVIRYSESTGNIVRVYEQMESFDEIIYYPVQTDDKIINYIMVGQAEDANAVIEDIYTENFLNNIRTLSSSAVDKVQHRITNTVLSVADKQGIPISKYRGNLTQEKNLQNYFTEMQGVVKAITEQISAKKNDSNNILAAKVNEYVVENLADSNLTIKHIANHFHFHENYISKLYKESYGENLSTAIERLRIEKASRLLLKTDIKVGEVAAAVGYSSDTTFRRAFKKLLGVSPANYRSSHTE